MDITKDTFEHFFKEPTKDKLKQILQHHTGEDINLEFKEKWIDTDKLAKIILGMINAGGGLIIIGVKESNNSYNPIGINEDSRKDKAQLVNQLHKYIETGYEVKDFDYADDCYGKLKGKFFQVIFVYSDPQILPMLSKTESSNIKKSEIYIRRGSSTECANNEEIKTMIDKAVSTKMQYLAQGDIKEELYQLEALYEYLSDYDYNPYTGFKSLNKMIKRYIAFGDYTTQFKNILTQLINDKLKRIKKILYIDN